MTDRQAKILAVAAAVVVVVGGAALLVIPTKTITVKVELPPAADGAR